MPNQQNSQHGRNWRTFAQKPLQTIQFTRQDAFQSRPQFAAKAFRAMLNRLGVKLVLSMVYHPQTDGTTERVNQEIKAYLAIYCHAHLET